MLVCFYDISIYDLNRLNNRIGGNNMSSKKKPTTKKVEAVVEEQIDPTPAEDVPTIQLDEVPVEEKREPTAQAESTSVVETALAVDVPAPVEVAAKPEPSPKPKPLTMISLHSELEELRLVVDQQAILIKQLMETPVRQRKPPTSNGKVQIKDNATGKIYPSKNNVYQSLLKAGELKELVDAGVFGADPVHNSFGCYNLFRAWPNRFEEVKPDQEQSI